MGLTKRFGATTAVDDVTLTVPAGSFFALLGPSGCGKTTTLRLTGGLEKPTGGRVQLGDEDLTELLPHRRPINTVFQHYALFPHLTVFENVAFGLRRRRRPRVRETVTEALEMVELEELAGRRPAELSGGQQQRVALARALVNRPRVVLLDEPLGALDLRLRRRMRRELTRLQAAVGATFVHVTHDQEEAMAIADTIAVMNRGRVVQVGAPANLYQTPATAFVANFLGTSNLVTVAVAGRDGADLLLDVAGERLVLPAARSRVRSGRLHLGIRPEKLRLVRIPAPAGGRSAGIDSGGADRAEGAGGADRVVPSGHNRITGTVTGASFVGVSTEYQVVTRWGQTLTVFRQNQGDSAGPRPGDEVVLHWAPENAFGLDGGEDPHEGETGAPTADPDPR